MHDYTVIRGLDPRIHLAKKMDGRVKPGHDEGGWCLHVPGAISSP
jgi:hypothetical protein